MKDPKPFEPVIVEWEDAHTEAVETFDSPQAALDGHKPAIRRSIGFWVGRTNAVVAFATDDDRCADSKQAVGGISYLPSGMVRRVVPLCRTIEKSRTKRT